MHGSAVHLSKWQIMVWYKIQTNYEIGVFSVIVNGLYTHICSWSTHQRQRKPHLHYTSQPTLDFFIRSGSDPFLSWNWRDWRRCSLRTSDLLVPELWAVLNGSVFPAFSPFSFFSFSGDFSSPPVCLISETKVWHIYLQRFLTSFKVFSDSSDTISACYREKGKTEEREKRKKREGNIHVQNGPDCRRTVGCRSTDL